MSSRLVSVEELDFRPQAAVFPSPGDWRDQIFYHLLVDRFDDNNPQTPPYDPTRNNGRRDPLQGRVFQGGNLKGITRRLDYIRNMGCTAIWISPLLKNRQERNDTYHGYAIQDFLTIDPRFGTLADMQELVRQAHRRGIYVILDVVINHTGNNWGYPDDQNPPFKEKGRYDFGFWRKGGHSLSLGPDDAVWPVELQDPDAYVRRGRITDLINCGEDERLNGDFYSLKKLDLTRPRVLDAMIRIHKYWIAATDIDGFRMDTVAHLDPSANAAFCHAIREYALRIGKANFLIFGEIIGGDDALQRYIGRNTPVEGTDQQYPLLDAVLDFPLYGILEEAIKGQTNCKSLRERYESLRSYYRDFGQASRYYITFVDNHDQPARRYRRFMSGSDDPRQAILAMGYLLTNLGIPCIYYGTEQGFDGGGDSDTCIRECMFGGQWGAFGTTGMHFFNEAHPIYRAIAAMARIRAAEPALRYGRQYFRRTSSDGIHFGRPESETCLLAFSRILDTDEILVAMNLGKSEREEYVSVDGLATPAGSQMVDLLHGGDPVAVEGRGPTGAAVRLRLGGRTLVMLKTRRETCPAS